MSDVCDSLVSGNHMTLTGGQYLLRAKFLLEEEQQKPNPDNALIGFVCESVRLWREIENREVRP